MMPQPYSDMVRARLVEMWGHWTQEQRTAYMHDPIEHAVYYLLACGEFQTEEDARAAVAQLQMRTGHTTKLEARSWHK